MESHQKKKREPGSEHHNTVKSPVPGLQGSGGREQNKSVANPNHTVHISRQESASYIHDMTNELKIMADSANFSFLAYLLELAIEESAAQQRGRL